MKPIALVFAVLFLPLTAESSIKRYARGYSEFWCDDHSCFLTATTTADVTMSGHKQRARAVLTAPNGTQAIKESGLVVGTAVAKVQLSHEKFKLAGTWWTDGDTGQVYCPWGQMPKPASFFSRKEKLGVSTICVYKDGNPPKPVRALGGPQLGWNQGYFPKDLNCDVKCKASHYTIYVVSPGGSITPAPSGTVHKGFSIDVDSGTVTCTGFIVSFTPDGIPGILPCKSCKEDIIFGP